MKKIFKNKITKLFVSLIASVCVLVVVLAAFLSMESYAWFTNSESVTNKGVSMQVLSETQSKISFSVLDENGNSTSTNKFYITPGTYTYIKMEMYNTTNNDIIRTLQLTEVLVNYPTQHRTLDELFLDKFVYVGQYYKVESDGTPISVFDEEKVFDGVQYSYAEAYSEKFFWKFIKPAVYAIQYEFYNYTYVGFPTSARYVRKYLVGSNQSTIATTANPHVALSDLTAPENSFQQLVTSESPVILSSYATSVAPSPRPDEAPGIGTAGGVTGFSIPRNTTPDNPKVAYLVMYFDPTFASLIDFEGDYVRLSGCSNYMMSQNIKLRFSWKDVIW